jgi:hypothetical protein
MMSAKDCVPVGGSFQLRAGEIFFPVQAYFAGMDCPFTNASLVSARDIVTSVETVTDVVDGWGVIMGSGDSAAVTAGAHDAIVTASSKNRNQEKITGFMTDLPFLLLQIA